MTSVAEVRPDLAAEWSPRNPWTAREVKPQSDKKAWWVGSECGHEWQAIVGNRVRNSTTCPYCANKRVLPGFNDLATRFPEVAAEWHPTKNETTPDQVMPGTKKKAWWLCGVCGREWESSIGLRVRRGHGCATCSARGWRLKQGKNLKDAYPHLASQWGDSNELTPQDVTPGSGVEVQWKGDCGHEWRETVGKRALRGYGCPYCSGNRTLAGFNDLRTRYPAVADEWHPTRNSVGPDQVTPGENLNVWWLCKECGREWNAAITSRVSRGSGCASCVVRKRGHTRRGQGFPEHLWGEWSPENPHPLSFYSLGSSARVEWVCEKGHTWQAAISDRAISGNNCKQCGNGGVSRAETEVADFVRTLGVEVRMHHRQIDSRYEFDVTVPERRIAIEFNGLYWHSEKHKPRTYHADKTLAAREAGWQVIHVWEDDWNTRRPVVEKMLARKLGVSQEPKLNARSLAVEQVSSAIAREVLDENHIQGYVPGSVRLGLVDAAGAVQALMVFRSRGGGVWELSRYATASIVRGGFSKLLKAFIRQNQPAKVVSFSDNTVSDGSLYEQLGFSRDAEIAPDYSYRVGAVREHKFNYRVNRFRTDPDLKFEEGLTERELAELNGLDRIYDAGKIRWVLEP